MPAIASASPRPASTVSSVIWNVSSRIDRALTASIVAPNAGADIIMLAADPLRDISNTRKVVTIWKDGRRYDPEDLRRQATSTLAASPPSPGPNLHQQLAPIPLNLTP